MNARLDDQTFRYWVAMSSLRGRLRNRVGRLICERLLVRLVADGRTARLRRYAGNALAHHYHRRFA